MASGVCKLCLQTKDLANSHFIPSALYKPLHASELPVGEPMMLTHKRIIQSSRQITAHAFCHDCEQMFNRGGEAWLLDKLATLTNFPLRDMVMRGTPAIDEQDFKAYCCSQIPTVDFSKIVHLALGIFWKSSVRIWNMIDGPAQRISLGPYEERARRYLIGVEPFPVNMSLITYLDANTPPFLAAIPPRRFQADGFHLFVLYINGLQCSLCVGKGIPYEYRVTCLASTVEHPIFVMPTIGDNILRVTKETIRNSRLSKGILATFEAWRRLKKDGKID
jgi:hypothetical protein